MIFNTLFDGIFTLILFSFGGLNPWVGMVVVSLLTALLMLFVFQFTSNQDGIRSAKDKIQAYLLELLLYRDNLSATLWALGNILRCNVRYMGHALRPALVMIVPVVLMLFHLDLWFGYRSLKPGESAIVKVHLRDGYRPSEMDVSVDGSPGFVVETPLLRIDSEREIDWRLSTLVHKFGNVFYYAAASAVASQLSLRNNSARSSLVNRHLNGVAIVS